MNDLDPRLVFKHIDHLTKRLDDTLRHSQVSTRNIYLINGAVLAAIYFSLEQQENLSRLWSYRIASSLLFILAIVNYLHANLLKNQNDWYRTIDVEIYNAFKRLNPRIWPRPLNEARKEISPAGEGVGRLFLFTKSSPTYVWIHIALTVILLGAAVLFCYWAGRLN